MIFIFHIRKALINDKRTNTAIYAINVPPIALKSNMTGSSFGSPSNILNTIKKSFKKIMPSPMPKILANTPDRHLLGHNYAKYARFRRSH